MIVRIVRSGAGRMTDMYSVHFPFEPHRPPFSCTVSDWEDLSDIRLNPGEATATKMPLDER